MTFAQHLDAIFGRSPVPLPLLQCLGCGHRFEEPILINAELGEFESCPECFAYAAADATRCDACKVVAAETDFGLIDPRKWGECECGGCASYRICPSCGEPQEYGACPAIVRDWTAA